MKENYQRPVVANSDVMNNVGVLPLIGLAAGYAAGRAITKAVKASPTIKMPSLKRRNSK